MSLNRTRLVQLIQILNLLLRQLLPLRFNRLINPLLTTESNNRARHLRINPSKRNLTHRPALLLRQLLNTVDRFLLWLGEFILAFGARGRFVR